MSTIAQWTIFETEFSSSTTYANPFWDVTLKATFTGPNGEQQTIDAFWDGGNVWRLRFSPTAIGAWQWQTICSDVTNSGLHGQSGTLDCVAYSGDNPLYQHGPLRLSANRRYFEHADGTPLFWLADTAWNGVLMSKADDWDTYLTKRVEQGFTAIQFVTTQWRGYHPGAPDAYQGTEQITINPDLFQREDERIDALNSHGLIASPVNLWTLTDTDPGQTLAEADAIRLTQYQIARWGAHQVVWLLGGDGCYERSGLIDRFRRIGRAAFSERHDRLVTLHPCGVYWPGETFRDEDWFDFIGYQSGHGSSDEHVRWLVDGPPAHEWSNEPVLPVINIEPNYEGHPSYHIQQNFTDYHVRRASYWSLLVSPPAGVTYGSNEIWVWGEEALPAPNHANIGVVQPWHKGVETPGLTGMAILKQFFVGLRWTELEPNQSLIAKQPGEADPNHFITAAQTPDGAQAVVYLPVGGTVALTRSGSPARWFNPRSGEWSAASGSTTFTAPDQQDWVLVISQ